jgi:hypothetical protein
MRFLAAALAALVLAAPAPGGAVLIASGDGSGNTTPPADDPGFVHVCIKLAALSCVYLGNGWVLTANHAGVGNVMIDGVIYPWISGSSHQLQNPDTTNADLVVFRINGEPNLPALPIRNGAPALNANVTMIGNGFDRGTATSFGGNPGWNWDTTARHIRWGTNRVATNLVDVTIGPTKTRAFVTNFTGPGGGTTHEAQAVVGDSGGGVFLKNGATWELAGTMFAIAGYEEQPSNTSIFGNETYVADLSFYRSQILGWVSTPECNDGLDDDADGLIDYPADPGCKSSSDTHERFDCQDGLDNDGDGLFDFPADAGCGSATSDPENPQCNDGLDNDGDLLVDLADPGCLAAWMSYESPPSTCGLGAELAPVLGLLAWLRARRGKRA